MVDGLVLVNGLPAAGKSTLARPLAEALPATLLSKDTLKQALASAVPAAPASALGPAAMEAAWALAAGVAGAVVLESYWFRARDLHRAESGVRRCRPGATVEVWCDVPPELARDRYATRSRSALFDDARHLAESWADWSARAEPLGFTCVIRVPTDRPVDLPALAGNCTGSWRPARSDRLTRPNRPGIRRSPVRRRPRAAAGSYDRGVPSRGVCVTCDHDAQPDPVPPRERIAGDEHWRVAHAFGVALLGWLVVIPRRHVTTIADLSAAEAATLGHWQVRLSRALQAATGCTKTYIAQFAEAEGFGHVHFHVVPRCPTSPRNCAAPASSPFSAGRNTSQPTPPPWTNSRSPSDSSSEPPEEPTASRPDPNSAAPRRERPAASATTRRPC